MNYKLIHQPGQLQRFIDFLPDLEENETYFLILIARLKWNKDAGIPSALKLKREAMKKDKIVQWISQLEVPVGSYKSYGDNGVIEILQDNLGVYIGYNPKDQYGACFDLIEECLDMIKIGRKDINVSSMARDVIQSSNGSKNFIDIDVDIKEGEDYNEIISFIKKNVGDDNLTFIKTSGGFHCLVRLENLRGKDGGGRWYMNVKKHPFSSDLNIMSHDLMPLVGCNQGKFVPHFID